MGYNYKKLKAELIEKKLADDGLVAWGQNISQAAFWGGAIGAAIASASNEMYTISKVGDKIAIIPFVNKAILYDKAYAFQKDKITKAKLGGIGVYSKLKITTIDGKVHAYNISQGKKDVKSILEKLEIPTK